MDFEGFENKDFVLQELQCGNVDDVHRLIIIAKSKLFENKYTLVAQTVHNVDFDYAELNSMRKNELDSYKKKFILKLKRLKILYTFEQQRQKMEDLEKNTEYIQKEIVEIDKKISKLKKSIKKKGAKKNGFWKQKRITNIFK